MVYTDPIKENHSRRRTRQRASLFFIGAKDAGTINENYLHKKCKKLLIFALQSFIIEKKEKDIDRTGGRSNGGNHDLQPAGDSTGAGV
jgi:hypothetical protein